MHIEPGGSTALFVDFSRINCRPRFPPPGVVTLAFLDCTPATKRPSTTDVIQRVRRFLSNFGSWKHILGAQTDSPPPPPPSSGLGFTGGRTAVRLLGVPISLPFDYVTMLCANVPSL